MNWLMQVQNGTICIYFSYFSGAYKYKNNDYIKDTSVFITDLYKYNDYMNNTSVFITNLLFTLKYGIFTYILFGNSKTWGRNKLRGKVADLFQSGRI